MRAAPRMWITVAVGVLVTIAVGGAWGFVIGPVTAVITHVALRRVEPAQVRRARALDLADFPFALDVLACCLRSGAPLDRALSSAAEAVNPALAERFQRAARWLSLGGTPAEALSEFDGTADGGRLLRAVDRSADTGARLADGMTVLAQELRFEREQSALATAHRAGVWMVLPLCLCFLPAFIVAGLVPVVISSLTEILNTY